jgi:hypothetical protein
MGMIRYSIALTLFSSLGFSLLPTTCTTPGNTAAVELQGSISPRVTNYSSNLAAWKSQQNTWRTERLLSDSLASLITTQLVDEIFPRWYGCPWEFSGHTNSPDTSTVACGYFVSTTLKHAGFNLNRYKLAQQASSIGVMSLDPADYHVIRSGKLSDLYDYFENKPAGLWTVGLSCHVGFLFWDSSELFFIHSNYLDPVAVEREKASESEALAQSRVYWLGNITHNPSLIKDWKDETAIVIKSSSH